MTESEERKILKKIQDSADDLLVPESLEPGQIEKKLKMADSVKGKKKWWNSYGAAAAAGAAVMALVCFGTASLGLWDTPAAENETAKETAQESADIGTAAKAEPDEYKKLYQYLDKAGINHLYSGVPENGEAYIEDAQMDTSDTAGSKTDAGASSGGQQEYSTTNLRDENVDEGDIVKTDGKCIFAKSRDGGVKIIQADSLKELASIVPEDLEEEVREIYVSGKILQLVTSGEKVWMDRDGYLPGAEKSGSYEVKDKEKTYVYTYNIENYAKPELLGKREQDGAYVTSRKNGDYLYLFTRFMPGQPESPDDLESYVPAVDGSYLSMDRIYLPGERSLAPYLVISSMNSGQPDQAADCLSIVAGGEQYYVSGEGIYTANISYGSTQKTLIAGFTYKNGKMAAKGVCSVKGYINDSFSIDEYEGNLRVLTTGWDQESGEDSNSIYIFNEEMKMTGKLENLAIGETIRSARFLGNTGYFVTYRQTDPLFAVDLSDVKKPAVLGWLKVTGFSQYLHFYGDNQLLGIGWEIDPDTQEQKGLKLSMFDISDPGDLKETGRLVIPDIVRCAGLEDYRAVLADDQKNILGFACQDTAFTRYYVYAWDEQQGFVEKAASETAALDAVRGLYIGDRFYLVTDESISAYDMGQNFQKLRTYQWE